MLYLNMYGDVLYNLVWGDKDLYRLAFSLAGQSNHFSQVSSLVLAAFMSVMLKCCLYRWTVDLFCK